MKIIKLLTVFVAVLLATSVSADVPNNLNYQGYLTDAVGDPVADGPYPVAFTIYDASVGGLNLWSSGVQIVNTENGVFSYLLGSNSALPSGIFEDTNRFLGITVGADPELTPRTKLNSAAYAHHSSTAENLSGDLFVYDINDTLRALASGPNGGFYMYGTNGSLYGQLYSFSWGELILYDNDGDFVTDLGAGSSSGGFLSLYDPVDGTNGVFLSAAGVGNSTVVLPDNAIDNTEILDEPGISSNRITGLINLTNANMQDLVTTSITIPASGYIYVSGRCYVGHDAETGYNVAATQIDETAGGSFTSTYYTLSGPTSGTNNRVVYPLFVDRVYFKTAGTYTFRMEAQQTGGPEGSVDVSSRHITAFYYPTAYGSVLTITPEPPSEVESSTTKTLNPDGTVENVYIYDLRQLELEAKKAALEAKEAELRLLKAQQQQNKQID